MSNTYTLPDNFEFRISRPLTPWDRVYSFPPLYLALGKRRSRAAPRAVRGNSAYTPNLVSLLKHLHVHTTFPSNTVHLRNNPLSSIQSPSSDIKTDQLPVLVCCRW